MGGRNGGRVGGRVGEGVGGVVVVVVVLVVVVGVVVVVEVVVLVVVGVVVLGSTPSGRGSCTFMWGFISPTGSRFLSGCLLKLSVAGVCPRNSIRIVALVGLGV